MVNEKENPSENNWKSQFEAKTVKGIYVLGKFSIRNGKDWSFRQKRGRSKLFL